MAQGDIKKGGNVDDLEVEVTSPGNIDDLTVGDAVVLVAAYEIALSQDVACRIFGQVTSINPGTGIITVRYRGLCTFVYDGPPPFIDGKKGVELSTEPGFAGRVRSPNVDTGAGIVIGVDEGEETVDVIL